MERERTIEIGGMSCGHCVMAVRAALSAVEGVQVSEVRIGAAKVAFDDATVSDDLVADAVRDAGYDVLAVRVGTSGVSGDGH